VNGQKIWTSIAMWSKWMILLVRTKTDVEAKHDGISCLLVEMESPGLTVRPIKNMAGGEMFAEVFFDDVRVPVENRLGEENQGWKVTVSALAHDIKNPLGIIMGYAELKLDEAEGREDGGEVSIWNRVEDSGRRIVNLVTGFLEASKAESGKLKIGEEPVQINRLLREASQQQEGEIHKKGLTLELDLEERLPDVRGDESQLDRVFWNLIGNAIKFTRSGGKVKISSWSDNRHICVAVQDTGVGISKEDLPLLFAEFRRIKTSEKIEGTGLGLFIVKTIIEAHKGTVWADSPDGQGAIFTIRIPIQ
ncbi:MAG: acyl-CoA dehydrogenase family protein, partial [Acidobacteria bacterium]|nr:acyl-CoA dehydrogenase family protein [Acidobacteriota bacterium]